MLHTLIIAACVFSQVDAKPVNLEKVNSPSDEVDPYVYAGTMLLYASNKAGTFDIFISKRTSTTGAWPAGNPLPNMGSKEFDERSPFHFALTNTIYYASNSVPDPKLKDLKNYDIKSRKGDMAPLPLIGISEAEDELHPFITPAGKEFYFSRKTKEGWIQYIAQGPSPGPIGKAVSSGFGPGFHGASVNATGTLMVLEGPTEDGKTGIFRSKRAKVGSPWSKPEPIPGLSDPMSKIGDQSPCISGDGLRLYFASDRPGGKGGMDLWTVPLGK